jgi:hypothetical protein
VDSDYDLDGDDSFCWRCHRPIFIEGNDQ